MCYATFIKAGQIGNLPYQFALVPVLQYNAGSETVANGIVSCITDPGRPCCYNAQLHGGPAPTIFVENGTILCQQVAQPNSFSWPW